MKILILGGDGMIGHKMVQVLSNFNHEIIVSIREQRDLTKQSFSSQVNVFFNDFLKENVFTFLDRVNPDVIINAIGITIRRGVNDHVSNAIYINSYFPHQLANWAGIHNKRLIHFSTYCVFSGSEGSYSEDTNPNALDYYGKTKGLGEVFSKNAITLRSSMIGPELFNKTELFEWVINNKEKEGATERKSKTNERSNERHLFVSFVHFVLASFLSSVLSFFRSFFLSFFLPFILSLFLSFVFPLFRSLVISLFIASFRSLSLSLSFVLSFFL